MLIRQAQVAQEGGWLVLRAQVSSQGKEAECFYSVPERFADFADTASSNCFLVGLLYPAMRWGEDIHVEGTTVHIIYALKMGPKYEKRYRQHFRDPDIIRFDMQHEAWIFQSQWTQPILDAIAARMV